MCYTKYMPSKYYHRNFKPQYYYHIYNRGAYKHQVFKDTQDYEVFSEILTYYLKYPTAKHFSYKNLVNKPYIKVPNLYVDSVRLVAYCLMSNHFHFILKQMPSATNQTNITNLMRRLSIAYAMYFQYKYKHTGSLFESKYKNVIVDSSEQLLHLSRYIHQHQTPYSSKSAYLKQTELMDWLYPEYILKLTKNYRQYINSPISKTDTEKIKSLSLE
jgi:REP-associated tyrosine transposase